MSEEPGFRFVDPHGLRAGTRDWEVLVAVAYPAGVAGVCRTPTGGERLLCGLLEEGAGSPLDGDRPTATQVDGHWVVGGEARPGTARMLVRERDGSWVEAAVAGDAWLAVTSGPPLAYRAEDGAGAPVRPALPAGARVVQPLSDATDACVACDAVAWDLVRWLPRAVGPHAWEHDEGEGEGEYGADGVAAVCRECGRTVAVDGFYAPAAIDADEAPEADRPSAEADDELASELTDAERLAWARIGFAEAGFPAYALAEWHGDRQWSGSSSRDDEDDESPRTTGIRLAHRARGDGAPPLVEVETRFDDDWTPPLAQLREALERLASGRMARPWDCSEAALAVRFDRERMVACVAAELALVEEIEVPVDGIGYPFLMARCAGGWAAFGVLDAGEERTDRCRLTVTVTATDQAFAPFALAEVLEIEPYLRRPVA